MQMAQSAHAGTQDSVRLRRVPGIIAVRPPSNGACLRRSVGGSREAGTWEIPMATPLVERTFRYACVLATLKRDEMIAAGRGDEIEVLAETVRELENSLKRSLPE